MPTTYDEDFFNVFADASPKDWQGVLFLADQLLINIEKMPVRVANPAISNAAFVQNKEEIHVRARAVALGARAFIAEEIYRRKENGNQQRTVLAGDFGSSADLLRRLAEAELVAEIIDNLASTVRDMQLGNKPLTQRMMNEIKKNILRRAGRNNPVLLYNFPRGNILMQLVTSVYKHGGDAIYGGSSQRIVGLLHRISRVAVFAPETKASLFEAANMAIPVMRRKGGSAVAQLG